MRDVLCVLLVFFGGAQRIELDSKDGRARSELVCIKAQLIGFDPSNWKTTMRVVSCFWRFLGELGGSISIPMVEDFDASCVVLMLSGSGSIPKMGRGRCERMRVCLCCSVPSGSARPQILGENDAGCRRCLSVPAGRAQFHELEEGDAGSCGCLFWGGFAIMPTGNGDRTPGQVRPEFRPCIVTSIRFNDDVRQHSWLD